MHDSVCIIRLGQVIFSRWIPVRKLSRFLLKISQNERWLKICFIVFLDVLDKCYFNMRCPEILPRNLFNFLQEIIASPD